MPGWWNTLEGFSFEAGAALCRIVGNFAIVIFAFVKMVGKAHKSPRSSNSIATHDVMSSFRALVKSVTYGARVLGLKEEHVRHEVHERTDPTGGGPDPVDDCHHSDGGGRAESETPFDLEIEDAPRQRNAG